MIWWKLAVIILISFVTGYIFSVLGFLGAVIGTITRDISDPDNPRFRFEFNSEPDECLKTGIVCFKVINGNLPSISQE